MPDPEPNTYMLPHFLPQPPSGQSPPVFPGETLTEMEDLAEVTQLGSERPGLGARLYLPLESMLLTTQYNGVKVAEVL